MMRALYKAFFAVLAGIMISAGAFAQSKFGGIVSIDKTVHDWGDVTVKDGPLSCSFTVTNISAEPVVIRTVAQTYCVCSNFCSSFGHF